MNLTKGLRGLVAFDVNADERMHYGYESCLRSFDKPCSSISMQTMGVQDEGVQYQAGAGRLGLPHTKIANATVLDGMADSGPHRKRLQIFSVKRFPVSVAIASGFCPAT
ncbi:hypothetical protein MIZ03_3261 [Rhodoferax lithotrophicus]|uniref:Uncharacterized protein n=1 Tax=Rhodoferax lithotrophicus TaxID=2798804 RepID=A0ABM7MPU1_9BURK|nr:hypothetical protein [Rhodoferax sp. MIZ03]BCO28361.1 hypothetical protein MIZ03_3261 [Rhodoferax sp. MIZ03]